MIGLTKQVDMTERQIERWWRYRRAQDKPSTLVKFCENSWRFLYYTHSFAFGLFVLWDKSWFWDIKHCWYGYPHQVSSLLVSSKATDYIDLIDKNSQYHIKESLSVETIGSFESSHYL